MATNEGQGVNDRLQAAEPSQDHPRTTSQTHCEVNSTSQSPVGSPSFAETSSLVESGPCMSLKHAVANS